MVTLYISVEAEQTTCSMETARLGANQTVVAFTFYGDSTYDTYDRDYFSGIKVGVILGFFESEKFDRMNNLIMYKAVCS